MGKFCAGSKRQCSEISKKLKCFGVGSPGQRGDARAGLGGAVGAAAPSLGSGQRLCHFTEIPESKRILPKVLQAPKRFKAPNPSSLPPTCEKPQDVMWLRLRLLSVSTPELKIFLPRVGGMVAVETICNHCKVYIFPANDCT